MKALSEFDNELENYSSIFRIAYLNHVPPTNFFWRKLYETSEAMNRKVKRIPDAKHMFKQLYAHEVWRVVYPEVKLPE
jgi:hypothetical protein